VWDSAIAIARGESPPPASSKVEEIVKVLGKLKAKVKGLGESFKKNRSP